MKQHSSSWSFVAKDLFAVKKKYLQHQHVKRVLALSAKIHIYKATGWSVDYYLD